LIINKPNTKIEKAIDALENLHRHDDETIKDAIFTLLQELKREE